MALRGLPKFREVLSLLAAIALLELLLGRIYTRVAIFLPLSGFASAVAEALSFAGFFLYNLTALLLAAAYGLLIWELWQKTQAHGARAMLLGPGALLALAVATGVSTSAYLTLAIAFVFLGMLAMLTVRTAVDHRAHTPSWLVAGFLATFLAGGYYTLGIIYAQLAGTTPPRNVVDAYDVGEAAAVAVAIIAFAGVLVPVWAANRSRSPASPLLPLCVGATLAALFSAIFLANPGVTSALARWALGFDLLYPWPLYAFGLFAAAATVLSGLRGPLPRRIGLGLLFCFVAGFELKLALQYLEAALGLLLLFSPAVGALLEE